MPTYSEKRKAREAFYGCMGAVDLALRPTSRASRVLWLFRRRFLETTPGGLLIDGFAKGDQVLVRIHDGAIESVRLFEAKAIDDVAAIDEAIRRLAQELRGGSDESEAAKR